MRMRATRLSAVRHGGGRRLSATARAVQQLRTTGRGLMSALPTENGFAFKDRAMTHPWAYPWDLEQPATAVVPLSAVPPGVRPWSLGANVLPAGAWTQEAGTVSESGGQVTITASGTTAARGYKSFPTVAGRTYRIDAKIVSRTAVSGQLMIREGSGFGTIFSTSGGVTTTTWASVQFVATSTSHSLSLWAISPSAGQNVVYEGVTIQEVIYDWTWLKPNLVTNGDFSSGTTGWTLNGDSTLSVSGGIATVTAVSQASVMTQSVPTIPGRSYIASAQVFSVSAGTQGLNIGTAAYGNNLGTALSTDLLPRRVVFTATTTTTWISWTCGTSGRNAQIDNITIQEIPGYPMIAPAAGGKRASARVNLLSQVDFQNGLTDAPTRSGLLAATTISGYRGALAFGHDGTTATWAYKGFTPLANTQYVISVVVEMTDGLAPSFASSVTTSPLNDFIFSFGNAGVIPNVAPTQITALGGGRFRVSTLVTAGAAPGPNTGVVKYSTSSPRTFKITRYDVRLAIYATGAYPPDQYVGDNTPGALDYQWEGFPVWTQIVGAGAGFHTVGLLDLSATDAARMGAVVAKLSDGAQCVIAELTATSESGSGVLALIAPSATAAANYRMRSGGSVVSSVTTAGSYAAPRIDALVGRAEVAPASIGLRVSADAEVTSIASQGTGNFAAGRYYDGGRALDGSASLPATNIRMATWHTDIVDATSVDADTWAAHMRERAGAVSLTY